VLTPEDLAGVPGLTRAARRLQVELRSRGQEFEFRSDLEAGAREAESRPDFSRRAFCFAALGASMSRLRKTQSVNTPLSRQATFS